MKTKFRVAFEKCDFAFKNIAILFKNYSEYLNYSH